MATKDTKYKFQFPSDAVFKQLITALGKYRLEDLFTAGATFRRILNGCKNDYEGPSTHTSAFAQAMGEGQKKITYQTFLAICVGTRSNFLFFYERMMVDVKKLCKVLCLCPNLEFYEASKFASTLFNGASRYKIDISSARKGETAFFCDLTERYYWQTKSRFSMPAAIADLIWGYLQPEDTAVRTESTLPDGCSVAFDFESQTFTTLEALIWAAKGGLTTTKGGSITYPSVKKMQKSMGIEEFYPKMKTGCGAYARSSDLLFPFAPYARHSQLGTVASPQLLKRIWEEACLYGGGANARWILLGDYENSALVDQIALYLGHFMGMFVSKDVFAKAPSDWIDVRGVTREIMSGKDFRQLCVGRLDCTSYLYVPYTEDDREMVACQIEEITHRAVCGYYALMCSWGLAECAFSKEEPADGSFDRMKWVRLTDLGRYVDGFSKGYTAPASAGKKKEWFADPERTILVAEVEKPVSLSVIAKFGKKITDRRFLVDAATVMTACKDDAEVEKAVSLLKTIIGTPIPKVWEDLFADIHSRMSIVVDEPASYMLIKLPQGDMGLMRQCANDPTIKQFAIKCEEARLMVKTDDYPKVLKAFRALGYMPDMTEKEWKEAKPKPERNYGWYY